MGSLVGACLGCGSVQQGSGADGGKSGAEKDSAVDRHVKVNLDSGEDACQGTAPTLMCPFCGETTAAMAICADGGWACPVFITGCGASRLFPCGGADSGVTCNAINELCEVARFVPPKCEPLPSSCRPGSCSCLDAGTPGICFCTQDAGVTIGCYPP